MFSIHFDKQLLGNKSRKVPTLRVKCALVNGGNREIQKKQ